MDVQPAPDVGNEPAGAPAVLQQPAVAALSAALEALGARGSVRVLPPEARTPEQIADHLGVPPAAIASWVVLVPPQRAGAAPGARRSGLRRLDLAMAGLGLGPGWWPARRHGREESPQGSAVVVITSCAHRVVPEQIADVLGVPALEVAAEPLALEAGAPVGAVGAVGPVASPTTLVDVALATQAVVWAMAGHPRTVFPTRYDELLRLTGGQPVEVG